MSEYQYYEFQAIDRPLDGAARSALRGVSSRARISANSFINHYDYGSLNADPLDLLARYFDLLVYVTNWGSRQFAMRLPRHLINLAAIDRFMIDDAFLVTRTVGDHAIISVTRNDLEVNDFDDGSGWLGSLAPLRAAVLRGDLRMFYLLWLMQVEQPDFTSDDAPEPLFSVAPLDGALGGFADFLMIGHDLLEAGLATNPCPAPASADRARVESAIRAISDRQKTELLLHLYDGDDPHLGAVLRQQVDTALAQTRVGARPLRTAGDLRAAALERTIIRSRQEAEVRSAAERRKAEEATAIRRRRQGALIGREDGAWDRAERLIEQRNASGYAEAVVLLSDLHDIAPDPADFARRIRHIRMRHAGKRSFIARLDAASLH